ncbi:xylosyltransferase sqv-6-like [Haliotis rubra]|uniref:xylosyltransferase sqv-6-like n=1 Tax=Haliotis rubra TaxID=36100 RepID=UPI001EE56317|nr:xylosyltransferase sqv-6-like [Haliotis rubra]
MTRKYTTAPVKHSMATWIKHTFDYFMVMILLSYNVFSDDLCNDCLVEYSPSFDNHAVRDHRLWIRSAPHQQVCFRLCRLDTSCLSFEFNPNTKSCRGHASAFTSPSLVSTSADNGNKRYTICPDYLGCFKDNSTRVLPYSRIENIEMTNELCKDHCRTQGYGLAGTENTDECYCGHSIPAARRREDSKCDRQCPGKTPQMCGGVWFLSVYSTRRP